MPKQNPIIGCECGVFDPAIAPDRRNPIKAFSDCAASIRNLGATGFQTYLGLPYATTLTANQKVIMKPYQAFEIRKALEQNKIKLWIHSSLTINICREWENHRYRWMFDNLIYDINQGLELGAQGVVVHLGNQLDGPLDYAIDNAVFNLKKIIELTLAKPGRKRPRHYLLLETPAQTGSKIGYDLETFGKIYKRLKPIWPYIGICVDTQHIFSAGYPVNTAEGVADFIKKFKKEFGSLRPWRLIHLNDSKIPLHGQRDRHEVIGKGYLFDPKLGGSHGAYSAICEFAKKQGIMMILETPKDHLERQIAYAQKCRIQNLKGGSGKKGSQPHHSLLPRVIEIFEEVKNIHEALGNVYEARAYSQAIRSLKDLTERETILSNNNINNLNKLPGIGKGTVAKIKEIRDTGDLKILRDLKADPRVRAIHELTKIRGVGPIQARRLLDAGFRSVSNIQRDPDGAGMSPVQKEWLKYFDDLTSKIPRSEVKAIGTRAQGILAPLDIEVIIAGSYRTGKDESKDVDLLLVPRKVGETEFHDAIGALRSKGFAFYTLDEGPRQAAVLTRLRPGTAVRQVDLRFVDPKIVPFYLLFFGSGMDFSRDLRDYAKKKGFKLTEKGLFKGNSTKSLPAKREEDIFKHLGLKYVPPEKRVGHYQLISQNQ